VGLLFTYAILRLQAVLPFQHLFNPQNLPAVGEHLAFNTAASFTTNTNWQAMARIDHAFLQMVANVS
jgi:K+-transporting ATPase ATPase A chain